MGLLGSQAASTGRNDSGQAIVESALTLPLVVFLFLGTLQLFLMLQGRIMAEYAAFRAARAGSVHYGDCEAMGDAALLALLPSVQAYTGAGTPGANAAEKLVNAWRIRKQGTAPGPLEWQYAPGARSDGNYNGPILWIRRERPIPAVVIAQGVEDSDFDRPSSQADVETLRRIEIRLIYFYALKIPFVNAVVANMYLAYLNLRPYHGINPLDVREEDANWDNGNIGPPPALETRVAAEVMLRYARSPKQYVFPIWASATMRMMTPARKMYFRRGCPEPL